MKFDTWLKNHGCDTEELWKIQNCLGNLYGFDSEHAKEASKAWEESRKDKSNCRHHWENLPGFKRCVRCHSEEKGECIMQCGCDPVFFDGESCKSCGKKANQGGKPYVDNDIPNAEFKKDQTYTNQGGEGHQGAFQGGAVSGTIAEEEPVCDECRKCGNRYCSHQNPSEEHSLKNCLEKVRGSAKGTTTPCPTCGLTENGMTVEEEGALKKEIEERENEPSMFIEELRKPSELVTGKQTLDHVPTALEEFIKRHDEEERAWRRAVVREINGLSGLSIEVYKPQSLSKFL